jgi:putative Holliday junction resolvase
MQLLSPTAMIRRPGMLMGLDVGLRAVGVAVTDASRTLSLPLGVVTRRRGGRVAAERLGRAIEVHGATGLVVGWPLQLDGRQGRQCSMVARFLADMQRFGIHLPFVLHDERYTTCTAREGLRAMGRSKSEIEQRHDAVAAAEILMDFMEMAEEHERADSHPQDC